MFFEIKLPACSSQTVASEVETPPRGGVSSWPAGPTLPCNVCLMYVRGILAGSGGHTSHLSGPRSPDEELLGSSEGGYYSESIAY